MQPKPMPPALIAFISIFTFDIVIARRNPSHAKRSRDFQPARILLLMRADRFEDLLGQEPGHTLILVERLLHGPRERLAVQRKAQIDPKCFPAGKPE
jgi:hypothetical protein